MPEISSELVNRYIDGARVFAKSKTEKLAVQMAAELNSPRSRKYRRVRNPHQEPKKQSKEQKEVRAWYDLIFEEIHSALCTRSTRYKKQMAVLRHSGEVLILYIASTVAKKLQVNVVVVAAPVAALLRMISAMSVSVFCKRFDAGML